MAELAPCGSRQQTRQRLPIMMGNLCPVSNRQRAPKEHVRKKPATDCRERERKTVYVVLTAQPSSCKDVIDLSLLSTQFFLFIQILVLRLQISKHLAAAVSGLVNLHLCVSLQLQGLEGLEEYQFRFDGRIDLDLHRLQAICRG